MRTLFGLCVLFVTSQRVAHPIDLDAEKRELLALHEGFKAAHIHSDADVIIQKLARDYVRVNSGKILHPDPDEMANGMRAYLGSTRFTEYRDLREPIVRVSADGTLGWIIVRLRARGTQTDANGREQSLEFVCAWISLFEKRDGEWVNVGDVSTFEQ